MSNEATQTVIDIGNINLTGNIIPHLWRKYLKFDNGKTDLLAIDILSELVYWYRPTIIKEDSYGGSISYNKKFKSDLLQKSYAELADYSGCSKRQAIDAIVRLEKKGILTRVFRTIETFKGVLCRNVLFIEMHPKALMDITNVGPPTSQRGTSIRSNVAPPTSQCGTNTEITTEITTDISLYNGRNAREKKTKISLEELSVVHIKDWLSDKRMSGMYINHDEHMVLEGFKDYCKANGKTCKDYVAAYRNAFKWNSNQPTGNTNGQQNTASNISTGQRKHLEANAAAEHGANEAIRSRAERNKAIMLENGR